MTPESLAGTYRLVGWIAEGDQGRWEPFGAGARGLITYTADGRMIGMLSRADRALADAPNLPAALVEDQARMAAGYLAYAGAYTLDGMTVTHHVEMSLFPNWIGTDQVRMVAILENGDLELSTPPETSRSGQTVVNRLRWRRHESW
ncbi:MAG: lipocalin-like domain-containing protein [Acidimicrobiia bacterium]|nr:lipocalin-like domain-containing protein [Acidimicrobiia bacterium]